jgi:hypothetical protein
METKAPKTVEIMHSVRNFKSITEYLRKINDFPDAPEFCDYLNNIRLEKNMKKEHLFINSDISQTYGHEIFRGIKHPSRDKIIQFAIGLGLDIDGTQDLLKIGRQAQLFPKVKRDALICYAIAHSMDIVKTNTVLTENGFEMLGEG